MTKKSILHTLSLVLFVVVASSYVVFAAPPGSPYQPGESLSPNCAPGDTNCTVSTSTPAGSSTHVQFNDGGGFGADSTFTYDKAADRLTVVNASTTNFTATNATITNLRTSGKILTSGSAPSVSSCGVSPSVVGNDSAGVITIGSGIAVTACTLTFSSAYASAPVCTANASSLSVSLGISSVSTTQVNFGLSLTLGDGKIYYHCVGV